METREYAYMVVPKSKKYPKGLKRIATEGLEARIEMYKLFAARDRSGYERKIGVPNELKK